MSNRLYVATRKGLFTVDRTKKGWVLTRERFFGDNCTLLMYDPRTGDLIVALDHGHFGVKMHRSRDDGDTWHEIPAPLYPPRPEGYAPKPNPMTATPVEWKLKLVWSLQPGGKDQPGRIWCGTLPGALFRSDDGGDSWSIVESLWMHPAREEWFGGGADVPGIHSICVDPRNSRHVAVGVSCGGVWCTEDDGRTWNVRAKGMRAEYMPPERQFDENIQDPHCLVRCAKQPDKLWVQHHNGIFKSADNGRTWTEIREVQPSTFGFPVCVHPKNGNQAWFVPAQKDEKRVPVGGRVAVTRTRDGGKSFDILRKGLPQKFAYDLVFRHAMDIDDAGETLAFGSTTGSLWITDDQGDSWRTVSRNLPPVYAVRFVKK
jgi:hypothetical protein